jgi:exopolysaccharide production protein ExoQ
VSSVRGWSDEGIRGSRSSPRGNAGAEPAEQLDLGYCQQFSLDWWLISFAMLLLMLVLAAGGRAIFLYIVCCGALALRQPISTGRALLRYASLFIYPAFCVFSKEWSDAPDVSLKQGLELVATVATAIIIFRRIAGRELASALLGPSFLICGFCLAIQPSAFHGDPLHGFIGSKNFFAFIAQVFLASAVAVAFDRSQPRLLRLFAFACVALATLELVLAQSVGAWITSASAVAVYFALLVTAKVSVTRRVAILIFLLIMAVPLILVRADIAAWVDSFRQNVLHKSSNLTGRSIFWDYSSSLIAEKPIFGHGFSAFWRQGNLDAEGLYRMFGIGTRTGINFHNQFIDVTVDLGLVGLCLFIVFVVAIGFGSLRRALLEPSVSTAFMTSLLFGLYARLPVESTLIGVWTIFTLLWFGAGVHAFAPTPGTSRAGTTAKKATSWRGPAHATTGLMRGRLQTRR